jgi:hypothetical protein
MPLRRKSLRTGNGSGYDYSVKAGSGPTQVGSRSPRMSVRGPKAENLNASICFPLFIQQHTRERPLCATSGRTTTKPCMSSHTRKPTISNSHDFRGTYDIARRASKPIGEELVWEKQGRRLGINSSIQQRINGRLVSPTKFPFFILRAVLA